MPPEEMFGKLMSLPDSAMGTYYELLLGEELDPRGAAGGGEARARRGGSWSGSMGPRRPPRPSSTSTGVHKEHLPPEEIEEVTRPSRSLTRRRASTCRR